MQKASLVKNTGVFPNSYQVAVSSAGLVAIALTVTDLFPLLTVLVCVVYGFILPATLLRAHMASAAGDTSELHPAATTLLTVPALLPLWLAVLSLMWTPGRTLVSWQTTALLAVVILGVTLLLVRRSLAGASLTFPKPGATQLSSICIFAFGLALGAVVTVLLSLVG
jgi:hypothetical protein